MKACVIDGPGRIAIRDVDIPAIGTDDVLVRVSVCGVCSSELFLWRNGWGAGQRILGHEPVGTIVDMGSSVKGFNVGDRVTGLMWEAFAEYARADCRNIVKVPEGLDDAEAMGEPISCLVSGAERTPVRLGDTGAVVGAGYMGLGFMQLMRLKGCGHISAVDVREEGRSNALRFGADEALLPEEAGGRYSVTDWDRMDHGINVVCEASGTQKGLELAGDLTAVHGVLSIVGWHQGGSRTVNMELWNWKAITIINAHERRYPVQVECMKAGLGLIARGSLNTRDMITHRFSPGELDLAFKALQEKPDGFIKAVVQIKDA